MKRTDDPCNPARAARQLSRRAWLQRQAHGLGAALALGGTTTLGALVGQRPAQAAEYRALVCVFLYGGNDGNNTLVPLDTARHAQYAAARGVLALPAASLVPLSGTSFGLHPALEPLAAVWRAGRLAAVLNVGPLQRPLDKAQYLAAVASGETRAIPDNLFSHSHQQALWESSSTNTQATTGWGGRAADVLSPGFPVIATGSAGRFGVSATRSALVVPAPGQVFGVAELGDEPWRRQDPVMAARATALRQVHASATGHVLTEAFAQQQLAAFDVTARLAEIVKATPGSAGVPAAIDAAFAPLIVQGAVQTDLGRQLYQIAKLIAHRATVRSERQIFLAQQTGYDTHAAQVAPGSAQDGPHAQLLGQLGRALACFGQAMVNLGMDRQVTSFTQSDFGRTLVPNASLGSDHAWGNHQLVMGGAVKGGTITGRLPELVPGGPDDTGLQRWEWQGRWIPGLAVDQYAGTLLRWLGADAAQLNAVLPNLQSFGPQALLDFV